MRVTFDIEKLNALLQNFYICTNITISLFDSDFNCIADAGEWQPYCLAIGEKPDLLAECDRCNRKNLQKAREMHDSLVYTCHAGIVESVTPVCVENTPIAYLMLGKFRDAEEKHSNEGIVCAAAEKYGLDKERMLTAYRTLPVFSKKYIDAAISTLQAYISHISNEHFIHLERRKLALQIERYIEEHLAEKIIIDDLCRTFRISRQNMYTIFTAEFNDTIKGFILGKRLQAAEQLLRTKQISVQQVAAEVGLADYNYFIRFFRSKKGISPLQYRKKFRRE